MEVFIRRLLVTWQHPEHSLFDEGAILINTEGQRFCDERTWPDCEIAVAGQPGKIGYLLLDERMIERYSRWPHFVSTAPQIAYAYIADYLRLRPDVAVEARTLTELARCRNLPPERLDSTVAASNQEAAQSKRPTLEGSR
jgi:fumarate reductase flavoprotein subunit